MKDLLKSKYLFAESRLIAAAEGMGVSFCENGCIQTVTIFQPFTRIKSLADVADEMIMIASKNHDLMVSVTCTFMLEMGIRSVGESLSLTSKQKIIAVVLAWEAQRIKASTQYMPVMNHSPKIKDCPIKIPFSMMSELWASKNHSQSLARLAERGGMAPSEILANVEGRKYRMCAETDAVIILNKLLGDRTMKIEGREVSRECNLLDPVTYVPRHAKGNAGHKDCVQGVIATVRESTIGFLNCKTRTVQTCDPNDLVWG